MAAAAGAAVLSLPPVGPWLDATMPRNLLIQVPALLALGAVAGWPRAGHRSWTWRAGVALGWGIGALMFWMIPRAVDAAVTDPRIDLLRQLSLWSAGAALAWAVARMGVEPRMALALHAVAMVAAMAIVYQRYPGVVCTVYDLAQQRITGVRLLAAAPALWVTAWVGAARSLARRKTP